jgi:hypothetical protein
MKRYAVFLFLLTSILATAQVNDKVIYVDESNNYHLLIERTTNVIKRNLADSCANAFVFKKN